MIKLSLSFFDLLGPGLMVMDDELKDVEDLFNYVMSYEGLTVDDKVAFLAALLSLRDINEGVKLQLYEKF